MKVVKMDQVKAEPSTNKIFQGGQVTIQEIIGKQENEMRVIQVNFSPGAVNKLHSHTFDQVLYITKGKGIVATEKEEIIVTPGTIVLFPAGEKHWHGATRDSAFSHIAVMPPGKTSF